MPIIEADGNRKYNTAVYIDRHGRVAGRFRKHTPTRGELDLHVLPGENNPEADFRVGRGPDGAGPYQGRD